MYSVLVLGSRTAVGSADQRRALTWPWGRTTRGRYARRVNGLQKRGSYTPRRVRERRAYQLAVGGAVAGVVGVVGLVLSVVGVIGATLPILALVVAAICVYLFRRVVAG